MNKAARDSAMTAELLVLFRIILTSEGSREQERTIFRRICREALNIGDEDIDTVTALANRAGEVVDQARTVSVFRRFGHKRRVALARRMAAIAHADEELRRHEQRFMVRVLDVLDLDRADIATAK